MIEKEGIGDTLHGLAVAGLFEDLGRHVAWCAAGGCEDVERFLIHDP